MWYKGYLHYHTSFKYPPKFRISPDMLVNEIRKVGGRFVFCAGDHGDEVEKRGGYWGWGDDYPEYRKICLDSSTSDVILIPALEIHLRFPPAKQKKKEKSEHHVCLPGLRNLKDLGIETNSVMSYASNADHLIHSAHSRNLSITLNHPYESIFTFGGPHPLTIAALYKFDYIELFTADWPNLFPFDFDIYTKFLKDPVSATMGCVSAVDNALRPHITPTNEPGIINSTYLYITDRFTPQSLMDAWNERKSYCVHGHLYFEWINPIPSRKPIYGKKPRIEFKVVNSANKRITKVEIYNKGIKVYEDKGLNSSTYTFSWEDENIKDDSAHYIIHIEAGDDHLVTSPINYSFR